MATGQTAWLAGVAIAAMKSGQLPSLAVLRQAQPLLRSVIMTRDGGTSPSARMRFTAAFSGSPSVTVYRPASTWKVPFLP